MSEASEQFWYFDQARNRHGPFAEADFVRLIHDGTIGHDSMVWYAGQTDWRPASQVERFAPLFAGAMPPPPAPAFVAQGAPASDLVPASAMICTLPVWGLFGRSLLLVLGDVFVIPAPWTATAFYRYVSTHTALPNGRRLTFNGQAGDIWYIFIAIALISTWADLVVPYGNLIAIPFTWALSVLVLRWICAKLGSEDGFLRLEFIGGIWTFIGLNVLLYISFFTIIGWAWVLRSIMRWICRNVSGTVRFEFHGTGGAILWRSLVVGLCCILVIPIPWMMRWYTVWFISQVKAAPNRT